MIKISIFFWKCLSSFSNECAFTENEIQYKQCLLRKTHKENIFKKFKELGGQPLNPNIKDTSAYLAALKRHRKEQAFDDVCLFYRFGNAKSHFRKNVCFHIAIQMALLKELH